MRRNTKASKKEPRTCPTYQLGCFKQVIVLLAIMAFVRLGPFIYHSDAQSSSAPSCQATSNIIKAASGKPEDLRKAVEKAKNGDTVLIPSGTFTFNEEVTIKKGIYLKGAGLNQTILKRTKGETSYNGGMIHFQCSSNMRVRVSDMKFLGFADGGRGKPHSGLALIECQDFRVFNSHFEKFFQAGVIVRGPSARGVLDHNTFIDNFMAPGRGSTYGYGVSVSANSNALWKRPLELGSQNSVFIEDNFFSGNKHGVAVTRGGRYTARKNVFEEGKNNVLWQLDSHGHRRAKHRGARSYEIYDNIIRKSGNSIGIRGGDGVIFNNILSGRITILKESCKKPPCTDKITDLSIWNNRPQNIDKRINVKIKQRPQPGYKSYTYPHPLTFCEEANNAPSSSVPPKGN